MNHGVICFSHRGGLNLPDITECGLSGIMWSVNRWLQDEEVFTEMMIMARTDTGTNSVNVSVFFFFLSFLYCSLSQQQEQL